VNINWNKISNCARTAQGDDLLARNGNKTNNLEQNISFVPTAANIRQQEAPRQKVFRRLLFFLIFFLSKVV
jgi:hypothetical protein